MAILYLIPAALLWLCCGVAYWGDLPVLAFIVAVLAGAATSVGIAFITLISEMGSRFR